MKLEIYFNAKIKRAIDVNDINSYVYEVNW